MEDNKIFVFLSHSHLDYEKVIVVRDLLEKEGFRPLMFFLKCLEKEGYEELTKTLIKEEIDNRHRFVLCDSQNAKESDWVKFEVEHIKETNRPYETVNLDWPEEKIAEAIERFKKRSTVFLSYPRKQAELARVVNEKLKQHDFKTFFDEDDLQVGDLYAEVIENGIAEASTNGYVLAFMNEDFRRGSWQYKEFETAMEYHGKIIPVLTSSLSSEGRMMMMINGIQWIDVQNMSISEASDCIVDNLMRIDRKNNR